MASMIKSIQVGKRVILIKLGMSFPSINAQLKKKSIAYDQQLAKEWQEANRSINLLLWHELLTDQQAHQLREQIIHRMQTNLNKLNRSN